MNTKRKLGMFAVAAIIAVGGLELGERLAVPGVNSAVPSAEAPVGRPMTPVSAAGVARRTVRRSAVGVYNC